MDQTVLSGLFALGGAIIGGLVTIGATVISNRKQVNLELKKQKIEYFNLKRGRLEEILQVTSKRFYADNVLDNTLEVLLLFRNNSHFISNNMIVTLLNSLQNIIDEYNIIAQQESSTQKDQLIHKICTQINDIISDLNLIIENTLKVIILTLEKEIIK